VPIAIKAAFLNCGQNCASGERFIVHRKVFDKFTQQVVDIARLMRQGPTLGAGEQGGGAGGEVDGSELKQVVYIARSKRQGLSLGAGVCETFGRWVGACSSYIDVHAVCAVHGMHGHEHVPWMPAPCVCNLLQ
jgi:acyl-CoA reductase-like NAD-dependent aldehyde dehydrogenase